MISTVFRTFILYIVVTFAIRLMGKRQIGDMQPNELVITLLISEIAAIPLQDMNQPILTGIVAIFVLIILEIVVSILAMKCFTIRKLINGKSVVIIKNGIIDQNAMKSVRMTVLDLIELLRCQDVFDISEVAFAVLEVNGDLSVLLRSEIQPVKPKDLNLRLDSATLPLPVISDGRVVFESLNALNISKRELTTMLNEANLKPQDIFLMTLDRSGNRRIVKKAVL